jgi:hypothetical protein
LTTLLDHGPVAVICEHVEDLAVLSREGVRFAQLKTRDRGSWSVSVMCDHGLESLIRSYAAARAVGILDRANFELWLEGPVADSRDTIAFVKSPRGASESVRSRLVRLGAESSWLDDFLERLRILPNQPTRGFIDDVIHREIGAIWPFMGQPEINSLYETLLTCAQGAQMAEPATPPLHQIIAESLAIPNAGQSIRSEMAELGPLRSQMLTREDLVALAPPRPGESAERLLERIARGSTSSMLELKLTANGGTSETVGRVQEIRAEAEVKRQLLLASSDSAEERLEALARRVLIYGEATALRVGLQGASVPAVLSRPAEAIVAEMLGRPADLASLDREMVFDGDGFMVFGFLGHLSDVCLYPWSASK